MFNQLCIKLLLLVFFFLKCFYHLFHLFVLRLKLFNPVWASVLTLILLLNCLLTDLADRYDSRALFFEMLLQFNFTIESFFLITKKGAFCQQRFAALFYVLFVVLITEIARTDLTSELESVHIQSDSFIEIIPALRL